MNHQPAAMTVNMTTSDELRSRLGRVGIFLPPPDRIGVDPAATATAIEDAGFTSVWVGGGNPHQEALESRRQQLAATKNLIVATGIVNIWAWDPAQLRTAAQDLAAGFPGRFILGLGVSHAPAVEALGHAYQRPLAKLERFLDELDHPASHGADQQLPPVVIAALGPKALELARDQSLGSHPYFTPPEHTKFARDILGPQPLLVPELAFTLAADPATAAATAHGYAERYLRLPNYSRNLKRLGWGAEDLAGAGSDRLISQLIPNGPGALRERIQAHLDAGADHVVIQPLGEAVFTPAALTDLAGVVTDFLK
jgi:probable F420-dependent oxidoreductase